ncbi:MAG TPA: 3'(2'),5'-bisphosphate nucleotidase CysQ [Candidatus Polarisedimenticolaceae bacterium]|nr:3'(2'),5'-bisphosphate nucleotidase CysQ [Candidatus Polarisedimenticolaceae bacterium]
MSLPFGIEDLRAIALEAGSRARAGFDRGEPIERKPDGTPVTATDREVDRYLRDALARLLPGSGWLSEETADDATRLAREDVWIVDPIDGTAQLVRGIPELAVSIGLVRRGRPIAAAVLNPLTGEAGAWVEGLPPAFTGLEAHPAPDSLDDARTTVSRTEHEAGDLLGLDAIAGIARPVGSVAYKLLRVASGADDLTYSVRPKREWDVCGGVALVRASGRDYLRLDGAPVTFNTPDGIVPSGAVAGPAKLAAALRERLLKAGRREG